MPCPPTPWFRKTIVTMLLGLALTPVVAGATTPIERRCGWFENPTPGNATLTDRDGEWDIGTQGGHQADGDWPEFADAQWVDTNGHHGYGCACLSVTTDPQARTVLSIHKAIARPLAICRADPRLHEPAHESDDN